MSCACLAGAGLTEPRPPLAASHARCMGSCGAPCVPHLAEGLAGGAAGVERAGSGALPGRGVRTAALLTGPGPVTCPAPPGARRTVGAPRGFLPLPAWSWSLAQADGGGSLSPLPLLPLVLLPLPLPPQVLCWFLAAAWPSLSLSGGARLSKPGGFCTPNSWLWLVCPQESYLWFHSMVTVRDARLAGWPVGVPRGLHRCCLSCSSGIARWVGGS